MGNKTPDQQHTEAILGNYGPDGEIKGLLSDIKGEARSTAPATHIVPSVGRVVWYWPSGYDHNVCGLTVFDDQPWRADICRVNDDGTVNLSVNDATGVLWPRMSVTLHQGDAENCSLPRPFATWMPYQKGQAAKTEAAESRAVGSSQTEHERLSLAMLAEQVRELRLHNDATEREINRRQKNDAEADAVHLQEVPGMPPHQVRMRQERDELRQRIYRLKVFISSDTFKAIEEDEQYLLEDQRVAMEKYLEKLEARIALFNEQQDA